MKEESAPCPPGYFPARKYGGVCWWCGDKATSREHRYKKSDLVRQFGRGTYWGTQALVRGVEGRTFDIQGPNSKEVKFGALMCATCNNARSQPFDRSYDEFTKYIAEHDDRVLAANAIDVGLIYGRRWREGHANLMRYVVKHAACRLAEAEIDIGNDLPAFFGRRRSVANVPSRVRNT